MSLSFYLSGKRFRMSLMATNRKRDGKRANLKSVSFSSQGHCLVLSEDILLFRLALLLQLESCLHPIESL